MTSGTYKLLFEVPNDKEFPISNNDNSSIKEKKKKKKTAGLKCAQPAGIPIVTGVNLQQFNTLITLSVPFYEHGFSLHY